MATRRNPRTPGARNLRGEKKLSIVRLYRDGRSIPEIARDLRIKQGTVYRFLARMGELQRQRPYDPRPYDPRALVDQLEGDQIFSMYETTPMSFQQVADVLGRPKSTVGNYHRRNRLGRGIRRRSGKPAAVSNPSLRRPDAMMRDGRALQWTLPPADDPDAVGPRQGDRALYVGSRRYALGEPRYYVVPDALYEMAADKRGLPRSMDWLEWLEGQIGDPEKAEKKATTAVVTASWLARETKNYSEAEAARRLDALAESGTVEAIGRPYLEPNTVVRLARPDKKSPLPTALIHERRDGSAVTFYEVEVPVEGPGGGRPKDYRIWVEANLLDHPKIDPEDPVIPQRKDVGAPAAPVRRERALIDEGRDPDPMGAVLTPPPPAIMAAPTSGFDVVGGIGTPELTRPTTTAMPVSERPREQLSTALEQGEPSVVLIVFGGRKGFPKGYNRNRLANLIEDLSPDTVVSGGPDGVEGLAADMAQQLGVKVDRLSKKATAKRNKAFIDRLSNNIVNDNVTALAIDAKGPGSADLRKRLEKISVPIIGLDQLPQAGTASVGAEPESPTATEIVEVGIEPSTSAGEDEVLELFVDTVAPPESEARRSASPKPEPKPKRGRRKKPPESEARRSASPKLEPKPKRGRRKKPPKRAEEAVQVSIPADGFPFDDPAADEALARSVAAEMGIFDEAPSLPEELPATVPTTRVPEARIDEGLAEAAAPGARPRTPSRRDELVEAIAKANLLAQEPVNESDVAEEMGIADEIASAEEEPEAEAPKAGAKKDDAQAEADAYFAEAQRIVDRAELSLKAGDYEAALEAFDSATGMISQVDPGQAAELGYQVSNILDQIVRRRRFADLKRAQQVGAPAGGTEFSFAQSPEGVSMPAVEFEPQTEDMPFVFETVDFPDFDEDEDDDEDEVSFEMPVITEADVLTVIADDTTGSLAPEYAMFEGTLERLRREPDSEREIFMMIEDSFARIDRLHELSSLAANQGEPKEGVYYYVLAFAECTGILWALRTMWVYGARDYVISVIPELTRILQDNTYLAYQLSSWGLMARQMQPVLP